MIIRTLYTFGLIIAVLFSPWYVVYLFCAIGILYFVNYYEGLVVTVVHILSYHSILTMHTWILVVIFCLFLIIRNTVLGRFIRLPNSRHVSKY